MYYTVTQQGASFNLSALRDVTCCVFIGDCCRCGGALVLPNDIIAGDDDGIVVIPPSVIPQVRENYRHCLLAEKIFKTGSGYRFA